MLRNLLQLTEKCENNIKIPPLPITIGIGLNYLTDHFIIYHLFKVPIFDNPTLFGIVFGVHWVPASSSLALPSTSEHVHFVDLQLVLQRCLTSLAGIDEEHAEMINVWSCG